MLDSVHSGVEYRPGPNSQTSLHASNSLGTSQSKRTSFPSQTPDYQHKLPQAPHSTETKPLSKSKPSSSESKPTTSSEEQGPERGASEQKSSSRGPSYDHPEGVALQKLRARDHEVRIHEQAHVAAGGRYVQGGPTYTYQIGSDGKMYAVGGQVSIDTTPVPGDPEATIRKAEAIERAATAPAQPSMQDAMIASKARSMAQKASAEQRSSQEVEAEGLARLPSQAPRIQAVRLQDGAGRWPSALVSIPKGVSIQPGSELQQKFPVPGLPSALIGHGLQTYAHYASPSYSTLPYISIRV